MSSSDSDDYCYGNTAKRLHTLLNNYSEDKIDTVSVFKDLTTNIKEVTESTSLKTVSTQENGELIIVSCSNDISYENDDILDQIIASNTSNKRSMRCNSKKKANHKATGRGTRGGRGKKSIPNENQTTEVNLDANEIMINCEHSNDNIRITRANSGRVRNIQAQRGRRRNLQNSSQIYPTYSVGNTEEYPDNSSNVQLFTSKQQTLEEEILDDNEELSVKVYWRSTEIKKFTIQRYQKLSQIFDFFAKRESVKLNNVILIYNEKILKPDDTPDEIGYNIAKFIDGGIVNSAPNFIENNVEVIGKGIKLKFQIQDVKKPFIIFVQKYEKLQKAMVKCADHIDKQIKALNFIFDGDIISGTMTPEDLDLEGDDCIDVKILS